MKVLSPIVVFVLIVVGGCTAELPTTPDGEDVLLGKAAQGDRSEWNLYLAWDIGVGEFDAGHIACMNDGAGEDAWWAGSGAWYYKEVVTPSGNVNMNLRYDIDPGARLVGKTTGDVWRIYRYQSQFHQHTRHPDQHTYFFQPDDEWFRNEETGERIKVLAQVWIEYDEAFEIVDIRSRNVSCARMGPR